MVLPSYAVEGVAKVSGHPVYIYQSQNRKGREILPSLSYHSNENNRQRHHFILKMEDGILRSVTYLSGCTDAYLRPRNT